MGESHPKLSTTFVVGGRIRDGGEGRFPSHPGRRGRLHSPDGGRRSRTSSRIRLAENTITKMKKIACATHAAPPATPVKPKSAAKIAIVKNTRDQLNITHLREAPPPFRASSGPFSSGQSSASGRPC